MKAQLVPNSVTAIFGFHPTGRRETTSITEEQWKDVNDLFRICIIKINRS